MLENSCLVVQHSSIINGLLLGPKSKRICISGLLVGIGPEEKWLVFAPLEDRASSRNIRAKQRQHFSRMCRMKQLIDWKDFSSIIWHLIYLLSRTRN